MPQCKAALRREVDVITQLKEALKTPFVGIQLKSQTLHLGSLIFLKSILNNRSYR